MRYKTYVVAAVSYVFAGYFFLYGNSNESWVFLLIFGTFWLLVSMYNTVIEVDVQTKLVKKQKRFGPVTFAATQVPVETYGAVMLRPWAEVYSNNISRQATAYCYLVTKDKLPTIREAYEAQQAALHGPDLTAPPTVGDVAHKIMDTIHNGSTQPSKLTMNAGLIVTEAPVERVHEVRGVAAQLAEQLGLPMYDFCVR